MNIIAHIYQSRELLFSKFSMWGGFPKLAMRTKYVAFQSKRYSRQPLKMLSATNRSY